MLLRPFSLLRSACCGTRSRHSSRTCGTILTSAQVRLFSEIYESDVLVASPLAIATLLAERRDGGADFLSSLEIAANFRADVLLMQNWAHVETTFACMNRLPKQQHDIDIMRVRCGAWRRTLPGRSRASKRRGAMMIDYPRF